MTSAVDSIHVDGRAARAGAAGRLSIVAGMALSVLLAGCRLDAAEEPAPAGMPPPPQVSVAEVVVRQVHQWDEFTGRIEAAETVDIRPRVSGYIEEVRYRDGAEVSRGDVLFVIDPRPYRAELARAEAELARAQAQYELARGEMERGRKLLGTSAISKELYDQRIAASSQSRAGVEAAEAALDRARLDLEFTEVRAPIGGRAGRAVVTAGNLVSAGETVLTTVVSIDPVYAYFEGDEQIYRHYKGLAGRGEGALAAMGNAVFVGLSDEQGYPHEGYMDFVDVQVNPETGTLRARAVLPNPDRYFTPGQFARVKLVGNGSFDAVLVDDKAILTDQDRRFVYVLGPDNRAMRRDVELGRVVDGLRIVTAGLGAGDRVIVHGVQKVFFPGMPVDPQEIAMGDPPAMPAMPAAEGGDAGVTSTEPQS
jgi:multidrug efflux system membrane fusion protein